MFFEALILGIAIGYIRRGKLSRLSYVNFSFRFLIYISALLYLGIIVINLGLYDYESFLYSTFLIGSIVLTGLFLIANISIKYMFIPLIGLALNLLSFLANNYKFPLSPDAAAKIYGAEAAELLNAGKLLFYTSSETATLSFLGNIIPIGNWFVVSIGDIIASLGVVLIVQCIMADKFIQTRSKITFSKDIFR
ncbi:MAG TPA: DUF5317 family protein [Sedimentibacter sp.]|nr:DUF5317 family protein [Sedimentibacter sp.]HQO71470.1 DUF5317 family protein [Sedimentibacter sp.]HQO95553.1 DUF5317 family protein [Sedimentibacter sp.]